MKKLLKVLSVFVLLLLISGIIGYFYIEDKGIPVYEVNIPEIEQIKVTRARVDRGQKLANMLCTSCHWNPETRSLTGKLMVDMPEEFGLAYSANITQDEENGIGAWTDAEIIYLLRTGLKPNGQYTPPWMPKLNKMADEDIYSIVAFLRSSEMVVQPSNHIPPMSKPSFLTKLLCNTVFEPFEMPKEVIKVPNINDDVEFGKYLALAQLECYTCHSEDFKTMDLVHPEKSAGFFGGGNPVLNLDRKVVPSANITMHKEHGIGSWTREEFVRCLRLGIRPDNSTIHYPMVPYIELSEHECRAIWEYLKTVPVLDNEVERYVEED